MSFATLSGRALLTACAALLLSSAGCKLRNGEACRCGDECRSGLCVRNSNSFRGESCVAYGQVGLCSSSDEQTRDSDGELEYVPEMDSMPVLDIGDEDGMDGMDGTGSTGG